MLDPYARSIGRDVRWADELFGYRVGDPEADLSCDERDNAAYAPLAVVVDPAYTWGDDRPPRTPWHKTIIYELHVKGFTQLHPDVPERLRGTYRDGVRGRHPAPDRLGITAVELLPYITFSKIATWWNAASPTTGVTTLWRTLRLSRYAAPHLPQDAVNSSK